MVFRAQAGKGVVGDEETGASFPRSVCVVPAGREPSASTISQGGECGEGYDEFSHDGDKGTATRTMGRARRKSEGSSDDVDKKALGKEAEASPQP